VSEPTKDDETAAQVWLVSRGLPPDTSLEEGVQDLARFRAEAREEGRLADTPRKALS